MPVLPISAIIPETHIVMFSPHYDDFLLGLGSYALELRAQRAAQLAKKFHLVQVFSRSNYQNGSGAANYDASLERIKFATGRRLIEELDCLDELLGVHAYRYELRGERECLLRGYKLADSELEFPHGMYPDFRDEEWEIFARLKDTIQGWAPQADTALVFPLAIKEHLDHFITREAGLAVAKALGNEAKAAFYFQEDLPYAGLQTEAESARIEAFLSANAFERRAYRAHPEEVVALAFKHYTSQVDDAYRRGILARGDQLMGSFQSAFPCSQLFLYLR
jgi:hypothetical protein